MIAVPPPRECPNRPNFPLLHFCLGERFTIGSDFTAREIEGDRGEPILGEPPREVGKEGPMRESFEPVTDDDGAVRRFRPETFTANGQSVRARNLERLRLDRAYAGHPSISPLISAHP